MKFPKGERVTIDGKEYEVVYSSEKQGLTVNIELKAIKEHFKQKPMKKVIRLEEVKEESKKPIQLTHYDAGNGWEEDTEGIEEDMQKIVYLGNCKREGDLFAVYFKVGTITFFKGHLNDGVY